MNVSTDCSRLKPGSSPDLDEALRRRQVYYESQSALPRCVLLTAISVAALVDANYGLIIGLVGSKAAIVGMILYLVEMIIFAFSLTSLLGYAWRSVYPMYSSPLLLSDKQYRLLSLDQDTPGFARSPEKEKKYPNPFSPLPGSLISSPKLSPPSPAQSSTPVNTSYNSWMSASPGSVSKMSPLNVSSPLLSASLNTSANLRRDHYSGYESPITDQNELSEYLNDYSAWESSSFLDKLDDTGSVASQSIFYWRGGNKPDPAHYRRTEYLLSTPATKTSSSSTDSPADKAKTEVLSQRLGVDPMRLVTWNENLRIWVTQTILRPLVSEVENINTNLPKQGVSDAKIGDSPVDRLRKVSSLPQVAANLPTLPALIPFLEVSPDQEYIINRIKELSSTGALSLYRWDAGGRRSTLQQAGAWTEKLPSDSELVLHLVATYLDSRLVASSSTRLSDSRETMPFTHSHFFKFGEKIEKPDKDFLAIVQVSSRPPHYVVQVGDKQLDVGGGRNNLLHTLLLFLHQVKEEREGMIGRVNLGLSGLNILWVLD